MNLDILLTIFFGFIAAVPLILFKKATDDKYSSWTYGFWWSALSVIFLAPVIILKQDFHVSFASILFLVLAALGWALANRFTIEAFKHAEATVVLLVARLSNVTIFIVGWLFLTEEINIIKIIGLVLTVVGSMSIIYKKGRVRFNKGFLFSLIPVMFLTAAIFFDKKAIDYFSPLLYIFLQQGIQVIFLFFGIRNKQEIKKVFVEKKLLIIPAILCFVIGYAGFIQLLGRNDFSVVSVVYATSVFLGSMLLGIVYLNEKDRIIQKTIGTVLTLFGILLLSF